MTTEETRDKEQEIMTRKTFNDFEKTLLLFKLHKDDLKRDYPQLYYSMLGILDMMKDGYGFERF